MIRGAVLFLTGVAWSSLDTYDPASLEPSSGRGGRNYSPGGGSGGSSGVGRGTAGGASSETATREARVTFDGRAREPAATVAAGGREKLVVVRVHNDDIHTVEEVRHAFMHLGMSAQGVSFLGPHHFVAHKEYVPGV